MSEQTHCPHPPLTLPEIVEALQPLRASAATLIQKAYREYRFRRELHLFGAIIQLMRVRSEAAAAIQNKLRLLFNLKMKNQMRLVFAEKKIAHPTSSSFDVVGSEDACFSDEINQTFGVADGVGSWKDCGLSAAMFAQELMQRSQALMMRGRWGWTSEKKKAKLAEALKLAHSRIESYGSSTVLLGFVKDNQLTTASLGDSSLIVLRVVNGVMARVYKTRERYHSFNCPFQLAHLPNEEEISGLDQALNPFKEFLKKVSPISDSISDAVLGSFKLCKGDIIVAATDGLFDNLHKERIIEIVQAQTTILTTPQNLAYSIASALAIEAATRSLNPLYMSPFARAARRNRLKYTGGKPDDITVVVGITINE
mmetsp:Transcript_7177/g.13162  ORF Transcript_7177/g.13162 Transcript_7177/m.13162 type:complete len:368 (+) Transcript_7177:1131-2234(+)